MTMTEYFQKLLTSSGLIPSIDIDYAENTLGNFGLYSTGHNLSKRYINGDSQYVSNFIIYFHALSEDNTDRLENQALIEKLCEYSQQQRRKPIINEDNENIGRIDNIVCSNGMLINVPNSIYDGYTYQLQVQITYTMFKNN